MSKNIWIINHYATDMYEDHGGRHYWFAKYLSRKGYRVTIICASFVHKRETNYCEPGKRYLVKEEDGFSFLFIPTKPYHGNGMGRIRSMLRFTRKVLSMRKRLVREIGEPDVIIGSSVHPLACYAAIRMSHKFRCKNIIEIRDLWPETLVMMGYLKERSLFTRMLYRGERWLYQKADNVVFTMEGGYQYICDRGWDKYIGREKVHYINNGVDLTVFDELAEREDYSDASLQNPLTYKILYTGTLGKANDLSAIMEVAKILQGDPRGKDIAFLIYGDGEERPYLESHCKTESINNIFFNGRIPKDTVPQVLKKANLLLIVNHVDAGLDQAHNAAKYGLCLNKQFEYLASGKPILLIGEAEYNVMEQRHCGMVLKQSLSPEEIADQIVRMREMSAFEYQACCNASRELASEFDFQVLTDRLERLF